MNLNTRQKRLIATAACLVIGAAVVAGILWAASGSIGKEAKQGLAVQALGQLMESDKIDYGFHVIDGQVVFEGRNHSSELIRKRVRTPVKDADAETFRALEQVFPEHVPRLYYGVDKNHVFVNGVGGIRVLDADPASFRLLDEDGRYACSKDSVFYRAVRIEGADPAAFRRLKGDFSVDDQYAYLGHTRLPAEASTFEATSPGYISDVWHAGRYSEGPYSTEGWSRDAKNIYFGNQRFDQADAETFEDLQFAGYAKDANNVYCKQKIVAGADPESFEILGVKYLNFFRPSVEHPTGHGPLARDRNHFYLYTEIDERDGPWLRSPDH